MLRIGFDAKRLLNNFTGFGNYSRNLVADLVTHYPEYECILFTPDVTETPDTRRILDSSSVSIVSPPRYRRYFWRTIGMRVDLHYQKLDVFHGLAHEIPNAVYSLSIPKLVTICDVVYRHFPSSYSPSIIRQKDKAIMSACAAADHIIAISESTKHDLVEFFGIDPLAVTVIYPSCDVRFRNRGTAECITSSKAKYKLPQAYFLYVGSITERKNLLTACQALERIPLDDRMPLVVIGKRSNYFKKVREFILTHNLESWVKFVNVDSNDDLPLIYQGASLFIYPSLYEGFGIPVLEALSSGVPVVTSNISSLPEAAGNSSILVDPTNPDELASAIMAINNDEKLKKRIVADGYAHSKTFSGANLSQQLISVYTRLCES